MYPARHLGEHGRGISTGKITIVLRPRRISDRLGRGERGERLTRGARGAKRAVTDEWVGVVCRPLVFTGGGMDMGIGMDASPAWTSDIG